MNFFQIVRLPLQEYLPTVSLTNLFFIKTE